MNAQARFDSKRIHVLHGTMEIAGQMSTLSRGLRHHGVQALSMNYYPSYLNYPQDMEVDLAKVRSHKRGALLQKIYSDTVGAFDMFHFHFGTSLVPGHEDLPLLADAGKALIMHHWGSDVRQLSIARRHSPEIAAKVQDEDSIRANLTRLGSLIDHAIISDMDLHPHISSYYKNIHIVPQVIDFESYPPRILDRRTGPVVIAHAPTSRDFKGTEHIFSAVDAVSRRHEVDFRLVEGVSHAHAMQIYAAADIVIDQVLAGSHGLLAIECMAMGKPVICHINERMQEHYPSDLPLVNADLRTLTDVLEDLVTNRDSLPAIGAAGRRYAERRHSISAVIPNLMEVYAWIISGRGHPIDRDTSIAQKG